MGWKEWPYWLKGGVLVFPLLILLIIILGFTNTIFNGGCSFTCPEAVGMACPKSNSVCYMFALENILNFPLKPATILLNKDSFLFTPFGPIYFILVIILILWFVIGAVIGWIYGKIKKSK